jgi:hypothetical protein
MFVARMIKDKFIMAIGMMIMICGSLLKINYMFNDPMPVVQYYEGSIIFFAGTLIAEASAIAILAKVISPKMKISFFNAGLLSGSADTLGRALGNATFTIFSAVSGRESVPFYVYIISSAVIALLLILAVLFFPLLEKHTVIRVVDRNCYESKKMSKGRLVL